jgi:beta-fructofuranosidase
MVIALEDKWIWDSWYAHDGDTWHAFFLQADKSLGDPELRHFNVPMGHAVSDDLVHWEHLGTCFAPAEAPAWDDYTTWTGSVVRDDTGLWHLFYTGTSRAEDGLIPADRPCHVHGPARLWRRVGDGLCLDLTGPNAALRADFERLWHDRAMRDPWVMRDPAGDGWLMFFTARIADVAEPNAARRHRFCHLARPDDLDASAARVRRRLRPAGSAAGLRGGRALVLPVLHCGRAFLQGSGRNHAGRPRDRQPLPDRRRPAGALAIGEGFLDGTNPCTRYAARILETDAGLRIVGF